MRYRHFAVDLCAFVVSLQELRRYSRVGHASLRSDHTEVITRWSSSERGCCTGRVHDMRMNLELIA
eukprot:4221514-Amphidinium_carterae.1